MKKTVVFILVTCMLFASAAQALASTAKAEQTPTFTTVKIPLPSGIDEQNAWQAYARYKDTQEPITLSSYYNGAMYATIPIANKDREIEVFLPETVCFSDVGTDGSIDFIDMEHLANTGVIRGNENGEAEPLRNVTRAEAVAMIMRFLGLESMPQANQIVHFTDVSKNDWFYSVVMSAYACDIIKGDSETTFSPSRNVTREEIMVMTANALQYADLRCPGYMSTNIADTELVSDWAKDAYAYIGTYYLYDYSDTETDWENPTMYLKPQLAATRANVARLLNSVQSLCQMYPSDEAVQFGFDKEMPVIDGSTSTYPFTEAIYGRLFANGLTHKQFPKSHSKTHTAYERLINGEVDMIFVSHHPTTDLAELAAEKGVELELIPVAYDAMVFFTNADNPVTGITQAQISNIYVNNAYQNWSEIGGNDALLYPYCRNNDSGSHAQMEKHFLNGNEIHADIKTETSFTMTNILTDVMAAQTENPTGYGLGYSIYYFFNNMDYIFNTKTELKLLAVDGVEPNDETIANGTYPLSNNTYMVLRKDTPHDAPARKMVEFMLTESGQMCVETAGYGKLNLEK